MRVLKTISAVAALGLTAPLATSVHVVRPGETLSHVAVAHGVSVADLARSNAIADPDQVWAGQRLTLPAAAASPTPGAGGRYLVRRGDTLSRIAAEHGVSVGALARANGITDPDRVVAGATLVIPAGGAGGRAPAPGVVHVVRPGDTLAVLARRYGTTAVEIAAANGLHSIHLIRIGQRLAIPAGAPGSGTGAAPSAPAPVASEGRFPSRLAASPGRLALVPTFDHWAATYRVPHDLLKAMTYLESGWQNRVVSSVGAQGIGQLMPDTVRFVSDVLLRTPLDPAVPEHNIRMSARFLRYLLDQTGGDPSMALAGYYQGLAGVRRHGVYAQTRAYVAGVLALRDRYSWT